MSSLSAAAFGAAGLVVAHGATDSAAAGVGEIDETGLVVVCDHCDELRLEEWSGLLFGCRVWLGSAYWYRVGYIHFSMAKHPGDGR